MADTFTLIGSKKFSINASVNSSIQDKLENPLHFSVFLTGYIDSLNFGLSFDGVVERATVMGGSYVGGLYQEHLISKPRVSLILFTHISVSLDWFYFISFLCVCM